MLFFVCKIKYLERIAICNFECDFRSQQAHFGLESWKGNTCKPFLWMTIVFIDAGRYASVWSISAPDLICRWASYPSPPMSLLVFKSSPRQRAVCGKSFHVWGFKWVIICWRMLTQSQTLMYVWRNALSYITTSWLPDSTTKIIMT